MAIQQHPLPQDITSYRFRLIGDMTIKQFASLGICIVLAVISYSLPLPFFFKYPLAFVFLALGVGMAFVPVQGRSLDIWILAFIKSIYSPTQYSWKKTLPENVSAETAAPTLANSQTSAPVSTTASIEVGTQTTPTPQVATPPVTEPIQEPSLPVENTVQTPPENTKQTEPSIKTDTVEAKPVTTQPAPVSTPLPEPAKETISVKSEAPAPSTNLPIPFTPTTVNTLVGLTLTTDNRILDGVLVEIKKDSLTLRATKSNKLGQFMFARPLENGLYQILAEKEGYSFTPYSLELTGIIVRPLKIQSQ